MLEIVGNAALLVARGSLSGRGSADGRERVKVPPRPLERNILSARDLCRSGGSQGGGREGGWRNCGDGRVVGWYSRLRQEGCS